MRNSDEIRAHFQRLADDRSADFRNKCRLVRRKVHTDNQVPNDTSDSDGHAKKEEEKMYIE